jgi:hypothetical protein
MVHPMPDRRGYLLPGERQILLRRFAPVLILFPECAEQAPYPDEGDAIYTMRGSYHPRAVEFFLSHARICYRFHTLLRHPRLWSAPRSVLEEWRDAERSVNAAYVEQALASPGKEYQNDPRYTGLDRPRLRAAIFQRLVQEKLGERLRGFDLPLFRGRNIEQWTMYFKCLAEADSELRRSVVYGRLVQGRAPLDGTLTSTESLLSQGPVFGPYDVSRAKVALQYWFQYYYDDWANRHEGDWEEITVLLELSREVFKQPRELNEAELLAAVTARDVGYASHQDGYRRLWHDVQKTTDGRPIVYVSRGSSASYFAWQLEGYPASARIGILEKAMTVPGRLVRGRRVLGRRWDAQYAARVTGRDPKNTDWVAADPEPRDRLGDQDENVLERLVPLSGRGVRRWPASGPDAGLDDNTYRLETNDLFWLEMVQEYGVHWGQDSLLPGSKGPAGMGRVEREKARAEIHQLARLETIIERALDALCGIRFNTEHAIPDLAPALRHLRPKHLRKERCFPRSVRLYLYTMWAWILKEHPEAWPGGPGLRLSLLFRGILYSGFLRFIRKKPEPEPLLRRKDPMYHLKSLLAQVRRTRYEAQLVGSKWDNPFAWVRHACLADTFYYGRTHARPMELDEMLRQLDCVDAELSIE